MNGGISPALVPGVGVEPKATLKTGKLLILLNGKNAKNTGFAQAGYTRGTRERQEVLSSNPP